MRDTAGAGVILLIFVALLWLTVPGDAATETADSTTMAGRPLPAIYPIPTGLAAFAQAITRAENSPLDWNNPGSLALGDLGLGVGNSAGVSKFASFQEGIDALYGELQYIARGASGNYQPTTPIAAFAQTWTGGDNAPAWAAEVIDVLSSLGYNVDAQTPVGVVFRA